jgi:hypothetical protein
MWLREVGNFLLIPDVSTSLPSFLENKEGAHGIIACAFPT